MTVLSIFTRLFNTPKTNLAAGAPCPPIEQEAVVVEEYGVYKAKVCGHVINVNEEVTAGVSVLKYDEKSILAGDCPKWCLKCLAEQLMPLSIKCAWCPERIVPGATVALRRPVGQRKRLSGTTGHYLGTKIYLVGCLGQSCVTGSSSDTVQQTTGFMVGTLQRNKTVENVRPDNGAWRK